MSDASPVHVVGAGGIGLFFAHELEQAGHEVVLCVRSPIEHPILGHKQEDQAINHSQQLAMEFGEAELTGSKRIPERRVLRVADQSLS